MAKSNSGFMADLGLTVGIPSHDALIAILVHMAVVDGHIDDREFHFVQRVLPDRDPAELKEWLLKLTAKPLNMALVAAALPTVEQRWQALRFGVRMAYKDSHIADSEGDLLKELAVAFRLPEEAVEKMVTEVQGRGGEVGIGRIVESLHQMAWDTVEIVMAKKADGELFDLAPTGSKPVAVVLLDGCETIAILAEGLVGVFFEGTTFIKWEDIVTYTRVPTLDAAVSMHREDGQKFTLVDSRYTGLATLLDRLFLPIPVEPAEPPVIHCLQVV